MGTREERIFERNPDNGKIRSRKKGDYSNTSAWKGDEDMDEGLYKDEKVRDNKVDIRKSILSDVWAANKKVVKGKWYVELSQVCEIIGGKI